MDRYGKTGNPTATTPLGLTADRNRQVLNLADWTLPRGVYHANPPLTIVIAGTAMNAGKTAAAYLIKGLVRSRRRQDHRHRFGQGYLVDA